MKRLILASVILLAATASADACLHHRPVRTVAHQTITVEVVAAPVVVRVSTPLLPKIRQHVRQKVQRVKQRLGCCR